MKSFNHTTMKSPFSFVKMLFTILIFIAISSAAFATGSKYQEKMGETLQALGQAQSPDEMQRVANQFLIIAKAEKKEWLPYYYHAYGYVLAAFMNEEQPDVKDQLLDEASASLDEMMAMADDKAEVHALHALYLLGRLTVNPAERGAIFSPQIQAAVRTGMAIDATNPRLRYVKLSTDMGTAAFFGTDLSEYCEAAERLYGEWDTFEVESPLHPTWGKDQVAGMLQQNCGSEK